MNNTMKHTFAITVSALALGGMILGTSSPDEAHWGGRGGGRHGGGGWGPAIAGGILGGLVAGAFAALITIRRRRPITIRHRSIIHHRSITRRRSIVRMDSNGHADEGARHK